MRKLLLASAAMLGATGVASAQAPAPATANMMMAPSQGMMALPWVAGPAANNNNNAYGQPGTYKGGAGVGRNAVPTPGTVVIRLNGRVEVDGAYFATSANKFTTTDGKSYKINPIGIGAYMRLYPGVDGMTTNGLRYGASVEIRQNFASANAYGFTGTTTTTGGAATGFTPAGNTIGTSATGGSGGTSAQTLYVRRAFAYLASDNFGIVRMGTTDGVISLFDPCIFSAQCWDAGIGQLNGGGIQFAAPGAAVGIPFAWLAQAGNEYGNAKIVYLSPQFFGLDFGVQYAPSMGSLYSNSVGGSPVQATTCNAPGQSISAGSATVPGQSLSGCSGTSTGADPTRWLNQVGVGARWQGSFGPVDLGVYAFYETAGKESFNGVATSPVKGVIGNAATLKYDNLSFISAAGYMTVNLPVGSVTYSADYIGGRLNGQLAMTPTGGVDEKALVTGLLYRNGPLTLGAEVGVVNSQGAAQLTGISQRREFEVAFGGAYTITPGLVLAAEYMYTQRHQGGFNFLSGATGAANNDVHGQGVIMSTIVTW